MVEIGKKVKVIDITQDYEDYFNYIGKTGIICKWIEDRFCWKVKFKDEELNEKDLWFCDRELIVLGKTNPNSNIIIKEV